jgi:hypothetical protein
MTYYEEREKRYTKQAFVFQRKIKYSIFIFTLFCRSCAQATNEDQQAGVGAPFARAPLSLDA